MSMMGRDKSIGYFNTKEEAAIAYDVHTVRYRGCVRRVPNAGGQGTRSPLLL